MNTNDDTTTPNIPVPAGAFAGDWPSVSHGDVLVRSLTWAIHDAGKCSVEIRGVQFADTGLYERDIIVFGTYDTALSAEDARALADALVAAADELDQLDGKGRI